MFVHQNEWEHDHLIPIMGGRWFKIQNQSIYAIVLSTLSKHVNAYIGYGWLLSWVNQTNWNSLSLCVL